MDVTPLPYGCDTSEIKLFDNLLPIKFYRNTFVVILSSDSECFDIEKTIWKGFECYHQIALISTNKYIFENFEHFIRFENGLNRLFAT